MSPCYSFHQVAARVRVTCDGTSSLGHVVESPAGVDAACATDPDDDAPIEQATAEERVLLTQDCGLQRRLSYP